MLAFLPLATLAFGTLAAGMAFLVTYEEYSRHGFPRRRLLGESARMAGATLLFFLVMALIVGGAFSLVTGAP